MIITCNDPAGINLLLIVTCQPTAFGDAASKPFLHLLSVLTPEFCLALLQRPVIVTCSDPAGINLSSHINLLRLEMQHPTTEILLEQLVLVSVCEGMCTSPTWLKHIIRLSQNDLRYLHTLACEYDVYKICCTIMEVHAQRYVEHIQIWQK